MIFRGNNRDNTHHWRDETRDSLKDPHAWLSDDETWNRWSTDGLGPTPWLFPELCWLQRVDLQWDRADLMIYFHLFSTLKDLEWREIEPTTAVCFSRCFWSRVSERLATGVTFCSQISMNGGEVIAFFAVLSLALAHTRYATLLSVLLHLSLFRGRRSTLDRRDRCSINSMTRRRFFVAGQIRWSGKSQNASVWGSQPCTQLFIFEGNLAKLLCFGCCQLRFFEEVSQIFFVLKLWPSIIGGRLQDCFVLELCTSIFWNSLAELLCFR